MKKIVVLLALCMATFAQAQERQVPLLTVNGEGKIKVTPDQVRLSVSVLTTGTKSVDVKKENDTKTDAVLKYLQKMGIAKADYQTQRVNLYDNYDYEKRRHNYQATQTINILLRDLGKYDGLVEGLVDSGVNNISGVEFQTSELLEHQAEARHAAILNARRKADDLVFALNQKLGEAFTVVDNTQVDYPRPMYDRVMMMAKAENMGGNETLAVGEIEVTANVTVSYVLKP